MILDTCLIAIVVVSFLFGKSKGFIRTLLSLINWFVPMIVAVIYSNDVAAFLTANTKIDEHLAEFIQNGMDKIIDNNSIKFIPESVIDGMVGSHTGQAANFLLIMISFFLIIIVINIACFLITRMFSTKHNNNILGGTDSLLGAVFGLARGAILVCLILAIAIPLSTMINEDITIWFTAQLEDSIVSSYLYENNPLMKLIDFSVDASK